MIKRSLMVVVVISLMSMLLLACSDDGDESPEEELQGAESEVCNDLESLQTQVDKVRDLDSSSTVEEAQDARNDVRSAFEDLKSSASGLTATLLNQLETAWNSLQGRLDDISQTGTLGDAATEISSSANRLEQARSTISSQLRCP